MTSQEEYNDVMSDGWAEFAKAESTQRAMNNRILRAIKSVKGKRFLDSLKFAIKECEVTEWGWRIARAPIGKYQKESYGYGIPGIWVQQYSSGDSGDCFHGTISILIKEGRWLLLPFAS